MTSTAHRSSAVSPGKSLADQRDGVDSASSKGGELFGHPRGLAYIVFAEAWERFSFYGMQALLVLYMASYLLRDGNNDQILGFTAFAGLLRAVFGDLSVQAMTAQIFGLYVGLIYLAPVLGGYLGDRFLGRTRAVLAGAIFMVAGHLLMAFESAFLIALGLLILGCGLLKGNLAAQVGALYAKADQRRDTAFTLYNVAITAGGTLAPLICGTLGERYGWHYGFGAAGIGMIVGCIIYLSGRHHLPPDTPDTARPGSATLSRDEFGKVAAILLLILVASLFWIGQTQVWNSYPLWIQSRVDRAIFDMIVPVTWFQSIDAGAAMVLVPLVLWLWRTQRQRHREPSELSKLSIGFIFVALAFSALAIGEWLAGLQNMVSMRWLILFHFLVGAGFLYIGPVMMSLISRTAPPPVNATMVSCYYLAIFLGGFVSGWLGRFYEPLGPLAFWALHALIALAGPVALLLLRRWISTTLSAVELIDHTKERHGVSDAPPVAD
ncbi:MAG: peptide MFS transporter [Pseudomonadota bacterium]